MSKLWHDVKAVQLQASEWKLPKLRQILIFAMIGLTAGRQAIPAADQIAAISA